MIKHSTQKPPNWEMLMAAMPLMKWEDGIIVTYGDTYYSQRAIDDDHIVHEETHVRQQAAAGGADAWWNKWLMDANFRLHEELEGYQNQYNYLRQKWMDLNRNERRLRLRKMAEWIATTLSGELYGRIITYDRALQLLKQ